MALLIPDEKWLILYTQNCFWCIKERSRLTSETLTPPNADTASLTLLFVYLSFLCYSQVLILYVTHEISVKYFPFSADQAWKNLYQQQLSVWYILVLKIFQQYWQKLLGSRISKIWRVFTSCLHYTNEKQIKIKFSKMTAVNLRSVDNFAAVSFKKSAQPPLAKMSAATLSIVNMALLTTLATSEGPKIRRIVVPRENFTIAVNRLVSLSKMH